MDKVNHPEHYTFGEVECIDAIKAALGSDDRFIAYCEGNALKYLWRWRYKGGLEDLEKAQWYLAKMHDCVSFNSAFKASGLTWDEWLGKQRLDGFFDEIRCPETAEEASESSLRAFVFGQRADAQDQQRENC